MLDQPISMVVPPVVGFKLTGKLNPQVTATDLVLTITNVLRKKGYEHLAQYIPSIVT